MGAVVSCDGFTECDTECNAAVVNDPAVEDPAFNVYAVT